MVTGVDRVMGLVLVPVVTGGERVMGEAVEADHEALLVLLLWAAELVLATTLEEVVGHDWYQAA